MMLTICLGLLTRKKTVQCLPTSYFLLCLSQPTLFMTTDLEAVDWRPETTNVETLSLTHNPFNIEWTQALCFRWFVAGPEMRQTVFKLVIHLFIHFISPVIPWQMIYVYLIFKWIFSALKFVFNILCVQTEHRKLASGFLRFSPE